MPDVVPNQNTVAAMNAQLRLHPEVDLDQIIELALKDLADITADKIRIWGEDVSQDPKQRKVRLLVQDVSRSTKLVRAASSPENLRAAATCVLRLDGFSKAMQNAINYIEYKYGLA